MMRCDAMSTTLARFPRLSIGTLSSETRSSLFLCSCLVTFPAQMATITRFDNGHDNELQRVAVVFVFLGMKSKGIMVDIKD